MPSPGFQFLPILAGKASASGAATNEHAPANAPDASGRFPALFLSALAGFAKDVGDDAPAPGKTGQVSKSAPAPADQGGAEDAGALADAIADSSVLTTALQIHAGVIPARAAFSDGGPGGGEMTPNISAPGTGKGLISIATAPESPVNTAIKSAVENPVGMKTSASQPADAAALNQAGPEITEFSPDISEPADNQETVSPHINAKQSQSGGATMTWTDNFFTADPLTLQPDHHGKANELPTIPLNAADATKAPAPAAAPVASAPTAPPPPAIEVSIRSVRHEAGSFEFRLDPPDLGRLIVEISAADTDTPRATVFADDAKTLELMRRHGDLLGRELERQGFTGLSLNFSERRDHGAAANMVSSIVADAPAAWADDAPPPADHLPLRATASGYDRTV